MRITNKIMQRNNLSNINTNKIYQDKLSNQMSTQKKINRPSDDPVVAIRALRLRSSVTEVTQYYGKNIPDAESWLNVTEGALKNTTQIITKMIEQCTKADGELKTEDRQILLEQLKALRDEFYSTGDADYAGRYVFTGYRTDTSLKFPKAQEKLYTITEQLDNKAIDTFTKIETGELLDINSSNFRTTNVTESNIEPVEAHRMLLSYDNCYAAGEKPTLTYKKPVMDGTDIKLDADGKPMYEWETLGEATVVHSYADPDPYKQAAGNKDALIFVPETGELLMGDNIYDKLMALKDDVATSADESEIRVTYQKNKWKKDDLRPEHYFACTSDPGDKEKEIKYNEAYLDGEDERQVIEYDVGFNQTIRINSTADECFQHGVGRSVDDLVDSMQEVMDIEAVKANIEKMLKECTVEGDKKTLQNQLEAADKALTYAKDKCQKMYEHGITIFQGYLDSTNLALTNVGTRSSKLELIENRMQNQKTTFETLKSENEDIDITEVAIQLSSAELTYEAALMASGKVMQTTLLNFI